MTWQEYATGLEDRLVDLHRRVHRGAYRAQPSRRVYIPKADGRQRPLGIAALEDKIVQQAVVTILNQIQRVQRLVRAANGPETVRKDFEVDLIDLRGRCRVLIDQLAQR